MFPCDLKTNKEVHSMALLLATAKSKLLVSVLVVVPPSIAKCKIAPIHKTCCIETRRLVILIQVRAECDI